MARFADVLTIINGKNQKKVENPNGKYPIYGSGGIMGYADDYICEANTVIIGRKGSINNPLFVKTRFWNVDTAFGLCADPGKLQPKYLYYFCEKFDFEQLNTTVTIPSLTRANLLKVEIPLPPFDEQRKIAAVLDKVSDLIAKRRQQLNKLDELVKSRFIEMFGDPKDNSNGWPVLPLGKLFTVSSSKRIYQSEQTSSGIPFLRISDLVQRMDERTVTAELYISEQHYAALKKEGLVPVAGDILVTSRGTLGRCYEIKEDDRFYFQDGMISWLFDKKPMVTNTYIMQLFQMPGFRKQIDDIPAGSTVNYLSLARLKELRVMCPTIELQEQFIAFVEQVDKSKLAVQQGLQELEILKKSLMQEYFE